VKVLLDENLDHSLRKLLPGQDIFTARFMGWSGLKNGELLRAADAGGIEVFVTGDRTLTFEQNLNVRKLAVVVLSAIQLPIIKANIDVVIHAIDHAVPGSVQTVNCGSFTRKKSPL
jgi:hypothetical protein